MFWTPVPETPIYEDDDPRGSEHDVRATPSIPEDSSVDAEAQTSSVE